ncbi:alpha/beta hydrolase [Dokdonia sp.]
MLLILKLKGVKQEFSKTPINYSKLRKEDVRTPKNSLFKLHQVKRFVEAKTSITEIIPASATKNLIIYCHGGAFISGPSKHHWDAIREIATKTNAIVWMIDYPKAPENKIDVICENIDKVYSKALEKYIANTITLIGDSVGGTLIISLVQRLVLEDIERPSKLVLISPVVDATLSNPEIEKIERIDPMLSKKGVLSAKQMCVDNNDLSNVRISPINGSFEAFPNTLIFAAENDITYPDQKIVIEKMKNSNTNLKVIIGDGMPHIWPILPIMKEAKNSLNKLITWINTDTKPLN